MSSADRAFALGIDGAWSISFLSLTASARAVNVPCVRKQIDPMAVLLAFVAQRPSQRAAAADLLVSPPFLSDVLAGHRGFSDGLLAKLGLRRIRTVTDRYEEAR